MPKPKSHKAAHEKRGSMALSSTSRELSQRSDDQEKVNYTEFLKLIRAVDEYTQMVQQCANQLRVIERSQEKQRARGYRGNDLVGALFAVGSFKSLELAAMVGDLRKQKETLNVLKQQVTPGKEISEDQIQKLAGVLNVVAAKSNTIATKYPEIDPEAGARYATTNNTMLNRIVDRFVSFVNHAKSLFGYNAGLKQQIISDLNQARLNASTHVSRLQNKE